VCGAEVHTCTPPCNGDGDCSGSGRPHCSAAARVCVECTSPADCAGTARLCYLRTGSCVQCLADADCTSGQHCRTDTHQCEM
jgi:Cys-rich repeat protein